MSVLVTFFSLDQETFSTVNQAKSSNIAMTQKSGLNRQLLLNVKATHGSLGPTNAVVCLLESGESLLLKRPSPNFPISKD